MSGGNLKILRDSPLSNVAYLVFRITKVDPVERSCLSSNGYNVVLIVSGFMKISGPVVIKIANYSFGLEKICNFLILLQDKNFL